MQNVLIQESFYPTQPEVLTAAMDKDTGKTVFLLFQT
jgi:hypothetical protein